MKFEDAFLKFLDAVRVFRNSESSEQGAGAVSTRTQVFYSTVVLRSCYIFCLSVFVVMKLFHEPVLHIIYYNFKHYSKPVPFYAPAIRRMVEGH